MMAQAQHMGYNLNGGMPMGGNNMMHMNPSQMAQYQAMQARHMAQQRPVGTILGNYTHMRKLTNSIIPAPEFSAGKARPIFRAA